LAAIVGGKCIPKDRADSQSLSLWLYNFYTKKWRGTRLDIGSRTDAMIQELKVDDDIDITGSVDTMSEAEEHTSHNSKELKSSSSLSVKATKYCGPLEACIGLAWFGEHSLVLLAKRRSRFCLEIISREVSKDSFNTGRPVVHKIVPLPPGWKPSFMNTILVRNSEPLSPACIIAVGNGSHIFQFHVQSRIKNMTNKTKNFFQIEGYEISKVTDVPINQLSRQSDIQNSITSISLPIRKIIILPPTNTSKSADMCALDSKGLCFYLTNEQTFQLIDPGPFKDIKLCDESFHINSSTEICADPNTSAPKKQVTAIILVSSKLAGSKYCLIPNEQPQPSTLLHVLSFPLESIPPNAIILGYRY